MRHYFLAIAVSSAFLFSNQAAAQATTLMFDDANDVDTEEVEGWDASAELGLLFTSGNTETESYKGKLNISRDILNWRHKGVIDYYRAEQVDQSTGEKELTADKFFVSAQTNYKFQPDSRSSMFLFGSYEEDPFSGFEYQGTVAVGYGARYRYSEEIYADYEIGPGYTVNKPILDGIPQDSEGSAILRMAGNLNWKISENSKFDALIATEIGEDNTKTRGEVSVSSNINGSLAMKFSIGATHNSDLQDDTLENMDTETAVTLVYTF
ncbi:MAG: DUF481 domain-containing protein [Idiomarina sp.]